MTTQVLPAHSLAEAYLFLMATKCPKCGAGPLRGADAVPVPGSAPLTMTIASVCGACKDQREYRFSLPGDIESLRAQQAAGSARVNPKAEPSRIIDVAQWIVLFRMIAESAAREQDKQASRQLGYEAAQCLEEAIKFYEDDNDLPPDDALFHDDSRQMRFDHPEEFSRTRLVERRALLPSLDAMEARQAARSRSRRRRWWLPWR
jgi:hypothetical protein